jgi:hypothetical protein
MSKNKSSKKSQSNVVTASYMKNQARRTQLQSEAKREREGRKVSFLSMENQFREKYIIIKWDLLFDLLLLSGFLWAQEYIFFAVFVFMQIYISSYFIFNYRKYTLPPFLMSLSLIPGAIYLIFTELPTEFRSGMVFGFWLILSYGAFWFIIIFKNRREFKNAQELELCLECNLQKENFVIHMGRYLCKECFLSHAYKLVKYHGKEMYQMDYDVLSYFEKKIGEEIPNYNLIENNDILKPEIESKLFYSLEENNVSAISIPNKNLQLNIPEEIGLLHTLRVLNFQGNKISKLPYALRNLYHLKILNLKNNDLDFLAAHSLKTLTLLRRRGYNVIR